VQGARDSSGHRRRYAFQDQGKAARVLQRQRMLHNLRNFGMVSAVELFPGALIRNLQGFGGVSAVERFIAVTCRVSKGFVPFTDLRSYCDLRSFPRG
jgi:hypothetical protein